MSSVKPATTLVFDSFSGNSLVYLIVLFRQKFPLVSVIVVVGLANLSCCCGHRMNVTNKPDKKMWKEIILFWSHVTSVFEGLSLSLRRAGRREPWEQGCPTYAPDWSWSIFLLKFISQWRFFIIWEICIILLSAFVFPRFCTVLIKNCTGALRQCGSNFFPVYY